MPSSCVYFACVGVVTWYISWELKRIMSIKESVVIRTTVVRAIKFHWLLEFCGSIFMDQILIMKTTRFCTVQKVSTPTLLLKHTYSELLITSVAIFCFETLSHVSAG